jgi:hypothetical protein
MSGEPAKEVVIVIRATLESPTDLELLVGELDAVPGVTRTWGWVGIDGAAQAVLAVVDPVPTA